jgi:SAM-dependent methyltransferase
MPAGASTGDRPTTADVTVRYGTYLEFRGWDQAPALIRDILDREQAKTVLEVGGGRSPTVPIDEVKARSLRYTVNDVVASELALADPGYDTVCCDMTEPLPAELDGRQFDLIFSRMVNEHVTDPRRYYENLFTLLKPGGMSVHMYATLFATPFVANLLLPDRITDCLLNVAFANNRHAHEKFPARYRWCRGPTNRTFSRLRSTGFEIEEFRAYFGHGYYIRAGGVHRLELAKARWLARHPLPALTSYAAVTLRRPNVYRGFAPARRGVAAAAGGGGSRPAA